MKIVIDMPEQEYNCILKSDNSVFADCASKECMMYAIKNGTPLPEGHGRLIAEPTREDIAKTIGGKNDFADCIRDAVKTVFDNAPTIIEADQENKK